MTKRRTRRAAAAAITAFASCALPLACDTSSTAPTTPAALLASLTPPDQFAFDYQSNGSEVLDCVLPNRSFRVEVDLSEGSLVIYDTGDHVLGGSEQGRALLGPRLLGLSDDVWAAVPLPVGDENGWRLRPILGIDLASYLLEDDLPEDPVTVARALVAAGQVVADTSKPEEGRTLVVQVEGNGPAAPELRATIRVTEDSVVEIDVSSEEAGEATGWSAHYDPDATVRALPEVEPTPIGDVLARRDVGGSAIDECRIGG